MDRHGTLIAGIIGAQGNNHVGVTGVAWRCRLMPVRAGFKTETGEGRLKSDNAAQAIIYAVQNGARIINLSWSSAQESHLIEHAAAYATLNGVLICAAAGNLSASHPQ